ncbi:MAG: C1 family peptidase [Roseicyclus sp.]
MAEARPEEFWRTDATRRDWVDLRDQAYLPTLAVLRQDLAVDDRLMEPVPGTEMRRPRFGVRNQGTDGRCVGFALANVIDIQRNVQVLRRGRAPEGAGAPDLVATDIVSADMLYRMARFHDQYPSAHDPADAAAPGVFSLRSVIKGFYHHGVCLDWPRPGACPEPHRWQSVCYYDGAPDQDFPTVAQAKRAHDIGLGAYYRLASVLNHFHAALNDAEAILASAKVHDGWGAPMRHGNRGVIHWSNAVRRTGSHAFAIVGYDSEGFHVLNSWGEDWGGYRGQAGIALWPYADWAQNVIDAWVLRLGVHAPNAFHDTVGVKGMQGLTGRIAAGSTPCHELLGHYMNLDDGGLVQTGSYPSFDDSWTKTRDYLEKALRLSGPLPDLPGQPDVTPYEGVAVWIPGSFEGIGSAFDAAVQRKNRFKALGLYPYSIFWCNGFAEKSIEVLQGLFDTCEAQAGKGAAHLDELIENTVRGVGRAIWRDMEMAARRAVKGQGELPFESTLSQEELEAAPGFVGAFFENLFALVAETGRELHIVTEGAGVLVLHEALAHMATAGPDGGRLGRPAEELITSLDLVLPAVGLPRARAQVLPLVAAMNRGPGPARARLHVPDRALEERLCFGAYGKSILHLTANAFEDRITHDIARLGYGRQGAPRTFLGMADGPAEAGVAEAAICRLSHVGDPAHAHGRVPHDVLSGDPKFFERILDHIAALRVAGTVSP